MASDESVPAISKTDRWPICVSVFMFVSYTTITITQKFQNIKQTLENIIHSERFACSFLADATLPKCAERRWARPGFRSSLCENV